MTTRGKNPYDQGKRFIETARALECDESEEHFDAALRKVAAHKAAPKPAKKPKGNKSKTAM